MPEEAKNREVSENVELLERRRSPIGESSSDGKTFPENRTEVGREGEVEGGLDGREFNVGETVEYEDVGGFKVVDEGFGISGEGEASQLGRSNWLWRLADDIGGGCGGSH